MQIGHALEGKSLLWFYYGEATHACSSALDGSPIGCLIFPLCWTSKQETISLLVTNLPKFFSLPTQLTLCVRDHHPVPVSFIKIFPLKPLNHCSIHNYWHTSDQPRIRAPFLLFEGMYTSSILPRPLWPVVKSLSTIYPFSAAENKVLDEYTFPWCLIDLFLSWRFKIQDLLHKL